MVISQKKPAFTLVEILISISIFAILTAIMFGGFSQEKNRGAVKLAADQLQVDLQGMQQNSQSGIISSLNWCSAGTNQYLYCTQASHCSPGGQCVSRPPYGGFGLHASNVVGQNTDYTLFADLKGDSIYTASCGSVPCNRDALLRTVSLPNNIRVNTFSYTSSSPPITEPTGVVVTFAGIKGDAILRVFNTNTTQELYVNSVTITLKHTTLNQCYAVTIQRVGGVVTKRQLNSSCL